MPPKHETPTTIPNPFAVGDYVRIVADHLHIDEVVQVLEASDDGTVRTVYGWLGDYQIEPATAPHDDVAIDGRTGNPIVTIVDGKPAKIDTSKPPTSMPLLEVPLETLVHDYNNLEQKRAAAASKAGYWRGEVKNLKERIDPILAEMRRRDDVARGVEPSQDETLFDEDDDDNDEDEND